jgi:nicotinate-nucleotide pyrophosphorylase (carboxylating)
MRHYMDETLLMLADQLAVVALQEDLGKGDLTGGTLLDPDRTGSAELRVKQDGVICGLQWLEAVFLKLDDQAGVEYQAVDGDRLRAGTVAAKVTCKLQALVAGERTALNLIQRLSGIATLAGRFADAIEGTRAMVFDTRKTTPGLRAFEKYAVRCGGGGNHRMGLYDEMMIKENHLYLSGLNLPEAIARLRKANPDRRLTAEAENVEEAKAAIQAEADVVLLDDFSLEDIRSVVEYRGMEDEAVRKTQLEVSGSVTLDTVGDYAETGVERISVGALTHSAPALDVSLKVPRE